MTDGYGRSDVTSEIRLFRNLWLLFLGFSSVSPHFLRAGRGVPCHEDTQAVYAGAHVVGTKACGPQSVRI